MNRYDYLQQSWDFQRIEKAINFIEKNFKSQPTLDQMAKSVYLNKYHFERLFKLWAGIHVASSANEALCDILPLVILYPGIFLKVQLVT